MGTASRQCPTSSWESLLVDPHHFLRPLTSRACTTVAMNFLHQWFTASRLGGDGVRRNKGFTAHMRHLTGARGEGERVSTLKKFSFFFVFWETRVFSLEVTGGDAVVTSYELSFFGKKKTKEQTIGEDKDRHHLSLQEKKWRSYEMVWIIPFFRCFHPHALRKQR